MEQSYGYNRDLDCNLNLTHTLGLPIYFIRSSTTTRKAPFYLVCNLYCHSQVRGKPRTTCLLSRETNQEAQSDLRPYCARILLEGSTYENDIGLSLVQYFLGDYPICNRSNGSHYKLVADGLFHGMCEWRLIGCTAFDNGFRVVPATGDIQEIDAMFREYTREPGTVFNPPRGLIW